GHCQIQGSARKDMAYAAPQRSMLGEGDKAGLVLQQPHRGGLKFGRVTTRRRAHQSTASDLKQGILVIGAQGSQGKNLVPDPRCWWRHATLDWLDTPMAWSSVLLVDGQRFGAGVLAVHANRLGLAKRLGARESQTRIGPTPRNMRQPRAG